jgi:hypothetical protein
MHFSGVVIHYLSSLDTAAAVLDAELLCSDRVSADQTFERRETVKHFDRVMSHTSSVLSYGGVPPKLKFALTEDHE